MLEKFIPYLRGYLEIDIEGQNAEKFINLALQNGVILKDVTRFSKERVRAKAALKDRRTLRKIARQSRCLFRVKRRRGLPFFWAKAGKRKVLFTGGIVFCMIFYLFGNLILAVEVKSPYAVDGQYLEKVAALAEEKGIKKGAFFFRLDFDRTENYLLWKMPDLIFADIKKEGVSVVINVVKRIDIAEADRPAQPGNIIAKNDAVIEEVMVKKGTAMVKKGDTVTKGQVLIAGYDGKAKVAAAGIVKARVWFKGYGEAPLVEVIRKNSGPVSRQILIAWQGEEKLLLSGPDEPPFKVFDEVEQQLPLLVWRKITLPVEIVVKDYYEQTESRRELDQDTAYQRAAYLAKRASLALVSPLAEIMATRDYPVSASGGIVRAKAVTEAVADIGEFTATAEIPMPLAGPGTKK